MVAVPVRQHTTGYDELIRGMSRQRNTLCGVFIVKVVSVQRKHSDLGQIVIDDVVGGKVEFIDLQKKR